ncbi:MAG: ABC transporter permease [Actinomycetales bacterium]
MSSQPEQPGRVARRARTLTLERVNRPQAKPPGFVAGVKEIWSFRELLGNLVRKELKVRYKDSVLGFLWTLVRPLLQLIVYSVAIGIFLGARANIPQFGIYLFTGLLAWSLFTDIIVGCTGSIVSNAGLIKKVYFPRELFPLATVGASVINFLLQLPVLLMAYVYTWTAPIASELLLVPLALLVLVLFSTALGLILAASNVYLRDVQYLVEIVLLLWFWMTPIVYDWTKVRDNLRPISPWLYELYLANPMANVVLAFQRALWPGGHTPMGDPFLYTGDLYLRLGILAVVSAVLLYFAQRIFARAQGNFAQEL